jgi:hypothetical protein
MGVMTVRDTLPFVGAEVFHLHDDADAAEFALGFLLQFVEFFRVHEFAVGSRLLSMPLSAPWMRSW